jgi:hypothetical protein
VYPVAVYEERMHLARRDQKDMFGFVRTLEYLLAERQYAATNMQKFAQRDLQWFQYLKNIGGVQNLKRAGIWPGIDVSVPCKRAFKSVFKYVFKYAFKRAR